MRWGIGVSAGVAGIALLWACGEETPSSCSTDKDCKGLGRCEAGLCVEDPTPAASLVADRAAARLGQAVTLDATGSGARGAEVRIAFTASPDGVGAISVDGARATFRFARPHEGATIRLVVTTSTGRTAEASVAIAPENSPPVVTIAPAVAGEPGEAVLLEATGSDPDGDALTYAWTGGSPGRLESDGARTTLRTSEEADALLHAVAVEVTDGHGGAARATLELTPTNVAPRITLGAAAPADHVCDEAACEATLVLPVMLEDAQGVLPTFSLVEGPAGVEVTLVERAAAVELVARAPQGTRIAGRYLVRVVATDTLGLEAAAEAELAVVNRAPTLVAHDGTVLSHLYTGEAGQPYRAERAGGVGVTFTDPDGDRPGAAAWAANSPVVRFADPTLAATALVVEGTAAALAGLTISATIEDGNGAAAAATAALPIGNSSPALVTEDDLADGHRVTGDPALPFERTVAAAALQATDPDGDPLVITWEPSAAALAAGAVPVAGAPAPTFRIPAAALPLDVAWSARARDEFGAEVASGEVVVRISNRAPAFVLEPASPQVALARSCAVETCCSAATGLCGTMSVARQFPGDATDGPLRLSLSSAVIDPDGDPLVAHVALTSASAWLRVTAGAGASLSTLPIDAACDAGSCPLSAELRGRLLVGCLVEGAPLDASATIALTLDDGLGGVDVSEVVVTVPDDPADGSCP